MKFVTARQFGHVRKVLPQLVYKRLFIFTLPCMNKKTAIFVNQILIHLQKTFLTALKSSFFPQSKSLSFSKTFSYCPPKQSFSATNTENFHPAITYCPLKNDAVLFISALTPLAVTPEPRTDSKPFRRRFVRKTGFGSCRRKTLLKSSSTEL